VLIDPNKGLSDQNMPNVTCEMQSIVRRAAMPWTPGMSVKEAIGRAARTLGINHRRATSFWYGSKTQVLADEADTLRAWHRNWLATQRERMESEIRQFDLALENMEQ